MTERIQKLLSQRGICSRRQAEKWIVDGRVTCNGCVCRLGQSADPQVDEILVDGKPLPEQKEHIYLMLHKPRGYVTTLSDEKGRKNASMLVADCGRRVYPVGRLDMDSEGLLLFTDDGEFAQQIMHPTNVVDKVYHVTLTGFTEMGLEKLKKPIYLDGQRIRPPEVVLLSAEEESASIQITIHEGKNRQVRRMCARAGMRVKRLLRIQEGGVQLGDLPAGKWRMLTPEEVSNLHT